MPSRVSQELEDRACREYSEGKSTIEVGKILGVSNVTVGNILRRNNIEIRTQRTNHEIESNVCNLHNKGKTGKEISLIENISQAVVSTILKRYGISTINDFICNVCFKPYRKRSSDSRFCSQACYAKHVRIERQSAGMCICCGSIPALAGKIYCEKCRVTTNSRVSKFRNIKKNGTACIRCGSNKMVGKYLCGECQEKQTARAKQVRDYRREAGICIQCGNANVKIPHTYCDECRRKSLEKLKKSGLCATCRKVPHAEGKTSCAECSKARAQFLRNLRFTVMENYGGVRCACCGETEFVFLAIDHVDGNGNEHRQLVGGSKKASQQVFRWIVRNNFPPGFQVLCHNCNTAKHILGECPHETSRKAVAELARQAELDTI